MRARSQRALGTARLTRDFSHSITKGSPTIFAQNLALLLVCRVQAGNPGKSAARIRRDSRHAGARREPACVGHCLTELEAPQRRLEQFNQLGFSGRTCILYVLAYERHRVLVGNPECAESLYRQR